MSISKRTPRHLDVDATDYPLHGNQEGNFFHGYYKAYCYLPLYIFCGEHLLCVRLLAASNDAAAGTVEEVAHIVGGIRASWPDTLIIVSGDSGFCREELMVLCEDNDVDFLLGLDRNNRLEQEVAEDLALAKALYQCSNKAYRVYKDFCYKTQKRWRWYRRVVGKAAHLGKGPNPRFVVTSLTAGGYDARELYEKMYCARGEMENRIKEKQLMLFADRTSTQKIFSNQIRLYFFSPAYVLVQAFRQFGLAGTDMANALRHNPAEIVQDWGENSDNGTQGVDLRCRGLSLQEILRSSIGEYSKNTPLGVTISKDSLRFNRRGALCLREIN